MKTPMLFLTALAMILALSRPPLARAEGEEDAPPDAGRPAKVKKKIHISFDGNAAADAAKEQSAEVIPSYGGGHRPEDLQGPPAKRPQDLPPPEPVDATKAGKRPDQLPPPAALRPEEMPHPAPVDPAQVAKRPEDLQGPAPKRPEEMMPSVVHDPAKEAIDPAKTAIRPGEAQP